MNKEAKVYMLPTEQAEKCVTIAHKQMFLSPGLVSSGGDIQAYHLYVTTDEEIKEGDCYIHPDATVPQNDFNHVYVDCRKIIATTDPKLRERSIITETDKSIIHSVMPRIPQSFIEEYCKAGGIDNVMVEYEEHCCGNVSDDESFCNNDCSILKLKVNPKDNTITITKVKDSWSKEEVIKLITKAIDECDGSNLQSKKWIEENL